MISVPRWLRERTGELVAGGLGLIVIAVVFIVVLPRIASYRDVWAAVQGLSWQWIVALTIAAILNVVTYAPPYMAALPGLGLRPALAVTLASSASTYVAPGGPAVAKPLSFAMLRGWGLPSRAITVCVMVTTVWGQVVIFGSPPIALALLSITGGEDPLLQTVALAGLVLVILIIGGFALALSSAGQARRVGDVAARAVSRLLRVVRRSPVTWTGESFVRFRRDTIGLLRRRWHVLTITTVVGHLTVYLVLLFALRALGVDAETVNGLEAFAAWSLVRAIGSIPITPGGLGIVELGLTTALVAFGAGQEEAVAVVLVYRFLTIAPPLVLGILAGATWRRHHPGWTAPQPAEG